MTSLDDREKGFEKKFADDQELEFRATARRNRMLGEWAAGLMGLENVEGYAQAVVRSEIDQPGDEDVLRKVSKDLLGSGLSVGAARWMNSWPWRGGRFAAPRPPAPLPRRTRARRSYRQR